MRLSGADWRRKDLSGSGHQYSETSPPITGSLYAPANASSSSRRNGSRARRACADLSQAWAARLPKSVMTLSSVRWMAGAAIVAWYSSSEGKGFRAPTSEPVLHGVRLLRSLWSLGGLYGQAGTKRRQKNRMKGSEAAAVARSKSIRRERRGASGLGVFSFDLHKAR
jgi:hypothetical protein